MDSQRSTRDPRFQSGGYYDILKQVATADMDTPIKEATSVISTSVASSSSTGQKTESVEDPAKYFGSSRPSSKREATGSRNYSVPSSFRSPSPSQPSSRSSSISTTSSSVSWRPRFYDPRVKDAHERRQTYECCCRTYLKEESLRQHQLNHMRCEKCGYECLPTLMSRHYVLEHSGDWKDPAPKKRVSTMREIADIDPEEWIAERKRKFPRLETEENIGKLKENETKDNDTKKPRVDQGSSSACMEVGSSWGERRERTFCAPSGPSGTSVAPMAVDPVSQETNDEEDDGYFTPPEHVDDGVEEENKNENSRLTYEVQAHRRSSEFTRRDTTPKDDYIPLPLTDSPEDVMCVFFARGYCKRGDSCRYLHEVPSGTDNQVRWSPRAFQKRPNLLYALFDKELQRERSIILQCCHYISRHNFFDDDR